MPHTYSLDAAAARLNLGRNTLIRRLRELGVLDAEALPAGTHRNSQYFRVRCRMYRHPVLGWTPYGRTELTDAGLRYVAQLLAAHLNQPRGANQAPSDSTAAARGHPQETTMPDLASTTMPEGVLHDAGELTVITSDGERTHHRAALVLVFENVHELQRAINVMRCRYRPRPGIPEEQLHPALTASA